VIAQGRLRDGLMILRAILRTAAEPPGGSAVVVSVEELRAVDRLVTEALEDIEKQDGAVRRDLW